MQTEIPEDVMKAAEYALDQTAWNMVPVNDWDDAVKIIARAIMAERDRPVQIKPLEWFTFDNGECTTASVVGKYDINLLGGLSYIYFNRAKTPLAKFDTVKEAKAAAQADYEKRVRSALVEA
jgi:hypothetical protein